MRLQTFFSPFHVLDKKENAHVSANKPACFLVSEEPGVPKALQQARNPGRGRPQSLTLTPCSRDLPRDPSPSGPAPTLQED